MIDTRPAIDDELAVVDHINHFLQPSYGSCGWTFAADAYVCLKSKPLMLLTGPAGVGKLKFAQSIARALAGNDPTKRLELLGHPWWAEGTGNVAFFTKAHEEFNKEKLLYLIQEAEKPENKDKVFFACLARISPAELDVYFKYFGRKLFEDYSKREETVAVTDVASLPPNLFLVGTLDTTGSSGWSDHLASIVNIVPIPAVLEYIPDDVPDTIPNHSNERAFLTSRVHSVSAVYQKLHSVLGYGKPGLPLHPFRGLLQIESLVHSYGLSLSRTVFFEVLTYVANAWSSSGNGIFDRSKQNNLAIAMDFAISHILLTRMMWSIQQRKRLKTDLQLFLRGSYPVAFATISNERR